MRKFFISADMEGCAAVSSELAQLPDRVEWPAARRWMTNEVLACAEALFAAGFDEVIAADGHGNAHNIDPDLLTDNIRLVRSWPRPLLQMQGIEDPDVQACAFIGYHAKSTTKDSILAHTYYGLAYRMVKLNGEVCSEGYLNAAVAGEFGLPVILVSGDQHTVEDAQRYAPEAIGFVAKQSIGRRAQVSLPPRQVCGLIKDAMTRAVTRPLPKPFVVKGPYHLEVEMTTLAAAEMLAYLPGIERTGPFSITAKFDRVSKVMRFVAFAMLYTPTGAPAL